VGIVLKRLQTDVVVRHGPGVMLHDVEIDWGWARLSDEERAIVRRHEAVLQADRKAHSVLTAEEVLRRASRELRGRTIRARAADDDRSYYWEAVDGLVHQGREFDETGMCPDELTAADFYAAGVTFVLTPIALPDSMLAFLGGPSLSSVVQTAWRDAGDEFPAGFRTPGGPRRVHPIYLPVDVWADLKDRAKQEERSISYLVQRAVTAAYALQVE
jgi:hypothetical protein